MLSHDTLAHTLALHVQARRTCADAAVCEMRRARVRTEQVDTTARRMPTGLSCRSMHASRCRRRCQRKDGGCGFSAELGLGAQVRRVGAGGEAATRTRGHVIGAIRCECAIAHSLAISWAVAFDLGVSRSLACYLLAGGSSLHPQRSVSLCLGFIGKDVRYAVT